MCAQITGKRLFTALLLVSFSLAGFNGSAQCKTFTLSDKGDTLNCVDKNGLKQGKWIVRVAELRGDPGYEEEGIFKDSRKEGMWRRFTHQGDPLAVETYKWGLLHGKSGYYTMEGIEHEESWLAIDPDKLYDTLEVPDLYTDGKYTTVIVKNEGHSMKHGRWTFYEPATGFIKKTEDYFRDSSLNPMAVFGLRDKRKTGPPTDSSGTAKKNKPTAEMLEWEKKNAGKKKVKVRDGGTGL